MNVSPATADTPLRQAWEYGSSAQAGRLACLCRARQAGGFVPRRGARDPEQVEGSRTVM